MKIKKGDKETGDKEIRQYHGWRFCLNSLTPYLLSPYLLITCLLISSSTFNSLHAQQQPGFQKPPAVKPHEHSATKALCWSIIPGGGQIYNHQVWKVPLIYGSFAAMGYFIYYNYNRMTTFRDEYLYRVKHNNTPNLENYANYPTSNIYSLYNTYNRNFQLMVIITAGIYALNLIDAYVFGHLFDFRIDDDLSLNVIPMIAPMPEGIQPMLGVTLSF